MRTPFDWANLFLGYIQGPQVDVWVQDMMKTIFEHIAAGEAYMDEWI